MEKDLDAMAQEVAGEQAAIDGQTEDTRERVLRMGKTLLKMQKRQKKDRTSGKTSETWEDFCNRQKLRSAQFPHWRRTNEYMLIARFPGAYEKGMSIKEAYKQAGKWKANGGDPPDQEKKAIKARPLMTIQAAAGKLERKLEVLTSGDITEIATEQTWTEDEILGAVDMLTLLRQSCNLMLRQLKELHQATA